MSRVSNVNTITAKVSVQVCAGLELFHAAARCGALHLAAMRQCSFGSYARTPQPHPS